MKQPGDILLISCYELGHQPLGLASPLGFLKAAGYPAAGIDAAAEKIPSSFVSSAKFIGIAVPMHTAMCIGVEISEHIRAINPDAHLCFYGLYASLNADHLLASVADSVIGGEYEQPLLSLVQSLEAGESVPPGLRTRPHAATLFLKRLSFAVPYRDGLPRLTQYAHLDAEGTTVPAGYVEASRGCLHTCLHCPITPVYQGRFVVIPADVVLADICQMVDMGAQHITFGDPDFLNGPGHTLKIARRLHDAFPKVTFDITTKVEHVLEHKQVFEELKSLGCAFVVSAVESVSQIVLERLKKGHTRVDIDQALHILNEAGIPMRPSLVAFTPWTTAADYLEMLSFIEERALIDHIDPVQYTIRLLVPPGSALLDQPDTESWLGPLDQNGFTYHWDHPDPRMDTLYRQVNHLVEIADNKDEDPLTTFNDIKSKYWKHFGDSWRFPLPVPISNRRRCIPKLTESWFC
ncbi:MAG: CUAEP/CCAEP-tail radical SAM protein [Gemmatimonadota bacterium]|nr:CUAEP/CCAEP-tail radical SAM protein [Gemmatimonadota bacterium]